jgi:hypothetical protein
MNAIVNSKSSGKQLRKFKVRMKRLLKSMGAALRSADRYRPELHYMRGPGPRSRDRAAATSTRKRGHESS